MKTIVIGTGKFACEVLKFLPERHIAGVFDSQSLPSAQALQDAEIIVLSVPPSDVPSVWPVVLESGTVAFWEAQDYVWPSDMGDRVKTRRTYWIVGCDSFSTKHMLNAAKDFVEHPKMECGMYLFSALWN